MAPSEPLRLTILKRFETVLKAIVAGDDFFFTPHKVSKHPIEYELAKYGPLYQVYSGDEAGPVDYTVGHLTRDETFYVNIQGIVHDRADLTTKLERALCDIRKALDEDAISSTAGTLGQLTDYAKMDESAMMAYFSDEEDDFALFNQKWIIHITGTY